MLQMQTDNRSYSSHAPQSAGLQLARKLTFTLPAEVRRLLQPRERDARTGAPLTVSQWAEKYREVTEGGRPGPWRNEFTAYTVGPMDAWSLPYVRKIYVVMGPQSGKSQIALNCLGYSIDQDPGPAMYVAPTEDKAKSIGSGKIEALVTKSRRLAMHVSTSPNDNTTLYRRFANGMEFRLTWAGSATALSEVSIEKMIFDEVDKYEEYAGKKEADPLSLGEQRTNSYPYTRKLLYISSPSADPSTIFNLLIYEADIVYTYEARCPACGHYQLLVLENIIWPAEITDARTVRRRAHARYQCGHCPMTWDDRQRNEAVRRGRWVPGRMNPDLNWEPDPFPIDRPENVGFWIPSWYSPFISLSRVAAEKIRSSEDLNKKIAFSTQSEVKPYRQVIKTSTHTEILKARCALAPQTVPQEAVALTCFVDVQKHGYWFAVRAFARDYTSWLIHYGQLTDQDALEDLLYNTEYPVAGTDKAMKFWRVGIDTGGGETEYDSSMTEMTYWWLIKNIPVARKHGIYLYGTKGSSRPIDGVFKPGAPLVQTPSGKKLPFALRIIHIDTAHMKNSYHEHVRMAIEGEPHGAYLYDATDSEYRTYLRQILAEEKRRTRRGREEWVRTGRDNHLFDCEVGALSLAHYRWPGGGVNIAQQQTQPAEAAPPPRQENNEGTTGFNRPDMGAIRERLSERFHR